MKKRLKERTARKGDERKREVEKKNLRGKEKERKRNDDASE